MTKVTLEVGGRALRASGLLLRAGGGFVAIAFPEKSMCYPLFQIYGEALYYFSCAYSPNRHI